MRLDKDDPKLMDYVLGELDSEESKAVASALQEQENTDAKAIVDELRGVANTTRRILREDEDEDGLSDEQRATIVGQVKGTPENVVAGPKRWFTRRTLIAAMGAASTAAVVAFSFYLQVFPARRAAELQLAQQIQADQKLVDNYQYFRNAGNWGVSSKELQTLDKPLTDEQRQRLKQNITSLESSISDSAVTISPEALEQLRTEIADATQYLRSSESKPLVGAPVSAPSPPPIPQDKRGFYGRLPTRNEFSYHPDESNTAVPPAGDPARRSGRQDIELDSERFSRGKDDDGNGLAVIAEATSEYEDWGDLDVGDLSGQAITGGKPVTSTAAEKKTSSRPELAQSPAVQDFYGNDTVSANTPEEEDWAEYNVGNLTGQQELPELTASNLPGDATGRSLGADSERMNNNLWRWNTPDTKNTQIVGGPGSETYVKVAGVKPFLETKAEPLSTFSIDVDTAAYSNVRRFLTNGQMPPQDAVRIEEMVNYFAYNYPQPTDHHPFAVAVHGAPAPLEKNHRLVRIGVKGKEVAAEERPQANLVFLLDVSGSMGDANKLPLVKESMKTLLSQLTPRDRVGIVTYAGNARKVLDLTPCSERGVINQAIDNLRSGGSTNGGGGIQMAYDMAQAAYSAEGINRVILATDGDFNVGNTSHGGLMGMIEARAKSGVFLTTLGFGMGNLKDSTLEQLADRGNGNYAYIDTHAEARKALGRQLSGTLHTIAKDVKIQVEFNPSRVSHYRLLGYENRALANQDFNDDTKDAGEIGAGHTVTALYEVIPKGAGGVTPGVDPLKYSETGVSREEDRPTPQPTDEWLTVKMRYKQPSGSQSTKLEVPLTHVNGDLRESDTDFRFAAAVAAFGQVLRNPGYRHPSNFDRILDLARPTTNNDGDREAFLDMVITAKTLTASR
jgi:Ca-activated chloride channel homolog